MSLCVEFSQGYNDPMNDLPVIKYPCLRKELWHRQRQTLQVAGRKSIAKSVFDVQITILGRDQRFFAVLLSQMDLENINTWKM